MFGRFGLLRSRSLSRWLPGAAVAAALTLTACSSSTTPEATRTALPAKTTTSLSATAPVRARTTDSPPTATPSTAASVTPTVEFPTLAADTATPEPPTEVPTPTPIPPSGPCTFANYSIVGESPIGRTYNGGDTLSVTLAYETDGCTHFEGTFDGYHSPGSVRYQYFCPDGCGPRLRSLFVLIPRQSLFARTGTVTLQAVPGPSPPTGTQSAPDLEGFTLCYITINFSDGNFGGMAVTSVIGADCGAANAPT